MFDAKMKALFFDTPAVKKMLDQTEGRALNRIGGRMRVRSRRSIKRRAPLKPRKNEKPAAFARRAARRVSPPGGPPFAYSTHPYASIKNILYAYEPHKHSVVVGPVRFGPSSPPVPESLEYGGSVLLDEIELAGEWRPVGKKFAAKYRGSKRRRRVRIRPRPTMTLALEKERSNIPLIFAGQI